MLFKYNLKKTVALMSVYLKQKQMISKSDIQKLLYLTDRTMLEKNNRIITHDWYQNDHYHPILVNTNELLSNNRKYIVSEKLNESFWNKYISSRYNSVQLKQEPPKILNQRELAITEIINNTYLHLTESELRTVFTNIKKLPEFTIDKKKNETNHIPYEELLDLFKKDEDCKEKFFKYGISQGTSLANIDSDVFEHFDM